MLFTSGFGFGLLASPSILKLTRFIVAVGADASGTELLILQCYLYIKNICRSVIVIYIRRFSGWLLFNLLLFHVYKILILGSRSVFGE